MKNQNHIGLLVGCFTSLMLYVLLFFWDASLELSELRFLPSLFSSCSCGYAGWKMSDGPAGSPSVPIGSSISTPSEDPPIKRKTNY